MELAAAAALGSAVALLHERPDRSQLVGLALAVVAVVLIVAP